MSDHLDAAQAPDRLLDAGEVAEILHVARSWVYEETRLGRMPHVRLGRYVRYRRAAIEAWVADLEGGAVASRGSRRVAT
jgi:excisionase family DNA binding protein